MLNGWIKIRTRPVRVAFLVDPASRDDLYRAIELSTSLWGGSYNPIVPAYSRTPKTWDSYVQHRLPLPTEIVTGYLEGFEPDIVVPMGRCAERTYDIGNRELVLESDLVGDIGDNSASQYGIDLIDLITDYAEKELKYKRNDDVHLAIPILPRAYRVFLASIFGTQSENVRKLIEKNFSDLPIDAHFKVSLGTLFDDLQPNRMFPRHLTSWSLEHRPMKDLTLFVCDATKTQDVIDYWNLRAAGHYVVPMPVQLSASASAKQTIRELVEENFRPHVHNPDIFYLTTIQKSRSVAKEAVDEICELLDDNSVQTTGQMKYSIRLWYPRLWDEWARENASDGIVFPFSHETELKVSSGESRLDFRSADPKLKFFDRFSHTPKFANEFSFDFFDSDEPMAEVMPEGGRELSSAIGPTGLPNWRFSSLGLVYLASRKDEIIYIDLPRAEPVMTEWFRERGWKILPSGPGRIAKQMYKRLGGKHGVQLLAYKEIIRLLAGLEKESGMPRQAVIGKLNKVTLEGGRPIDSEHLLGRLLEVNAIRLGVKIQCPICTRYNWFELNGLEYELTCRFCLSDFEPPLISPKDIEWSYRAIGPFASTTAQGSFTVLLTLKFIGGVYEQRTTPLFSYIAEKDGKILEADLTFLYKRRNWNDSRTKVVHAECKSFNRFEEHDVARMTDLSVAFPGSVLIFASLNESLSREEQNIIKPLANSERMKRICSESYSSIVILTGTELFSARGAAECWKGREGIYEEVRDINFDFSDLSVLADATQQIYLGLQSWKDWSQTKRNSAVVRIRRSAR